MSSVNAAGPRTSSHDTWGHRGEESVYATRENTTEPHLNRSMSRYPAGDASGDRARGVGSVSKVEMVTPMALIYKVLFSSISTFETPPGDRARGVLSIVHPQALAFNGQDLHQSRLHPTGVCT